MNQPETPVLSDIPGQAYPTEVVSEFMQACTRGEAIRQMGCGCSITNIQKTISLRDYVQVSQSVVENNPLPVGMQQIISTCNQQAMIALQKSQYAQQQQAQALARQQLEQQYAVDSYRNRMAISRAMAADQGRLHVIGAENVGRAMTMRYGDSPAPPYPCDYSNQRDSMGRYCGDRAATVRPGGRQ
jgi:hypothetical protein